MADLIAESYDTLLRRAEREAARLPDYFLQQSRDWAGGLYHDYATLLDQIPTQLRGKRVLDFGCKYGHLAPLLLARGCSAVVGVDAQSDYVSAGRRILSDLWPSVSFSMTHEGFIDLPSECVDVVIMNEVISHVNPAFLDTVWSEAARVLAPRGILFISDGNNASNPVARRKLLELYEKWEKGPAGSRTDRDTVTQPFVERRQKLIREWQPGLPEAEVLWLAGNTSGMFGSAFKATVDEYAASKKLILRPYRRGQCPASPEASGVVMERAFHPVQLELWLDEYGFDARQIEPRGSFARSGVLGPAKSLYAFLRYHARRAADRDWYRSAYEGFQIVAVKRS